jgi:catechol 2,3-dioxygenase-like lactoylglutathione lyase family enzyme
MRQRVDFITLGVEDLDAARRFYRDGLGWTPLLDVADEVVFFQVGHGLVLGLFRADKMAADLGAEAPTGPVGAGVTLSHNVDRAEAVAEVLAAAEAAGGTIIKPAQRADFGGVNGHVADPAGYVWEIAHNPGWSVAPDGTVRMEPIG